MTAILWANWLPARSQPVDTLIRPEALRSIVPLSPSAMQTMQNWTLWVQSILEWKNPRKIIIVWPCSADYPEPMLIYWEKLARLAEEVKERILIVCRFYTNKPRTVWWEWAFKWVSRWTPDGVIDINKWLLSNRALAIQLLEMWLPLADEMTHELLMEHEADILSYVALWARTSESPSHREVISGQNIPFWIKNPRDGDIADMVNWIESAQYPDYYIGWDGNIHSTQWNPWAHGVLRWWKKWPNYWRENLVKAHKEMNSPKRKPLINKGMVIDASHDNVARKLDGTKDPLDQANVVHNVLKDLQDADSEIRELVKGFMIESYLRTGNQKCENWTRWEDWLSYTDPCMWWDETESLIKEIADQAI